MIEIITECIAGFKERTFGLLIKNVSDDCLFMSKNSVCLGKAKLVKYLDDIHSSYNEISLSLLNSVRDSSDTILISWVFRGIKRHDQTPSSIFGTSIIQFNENKKIRHIKSTTVTA